MVRLLLLGYYCYVWVRLLLLCMISVGITGHATFGSSDKMEILIQCNNSKINLGETIHQPFALLSLISFATIVLHYCLALLCCTIVCGLLLFRAF